MLTPTKATSDATVIMRARSHALLSTSDARLLRRGLCSRFPTTMTISTIAGKIRTSTVYLPPRACHSDTQSDSDSAVQKDHSTQMIQKVAKVLTVSNAKLRQVFADVPRLRLRPYLISFFFLMIRRPPRITQNSA